MITTFIASCVLSTQQTSGEFMMGVQAWTFHRVTAFEAVEKTAKAGAKFIELYPGQKLKPDSDVTVGPEMGEKATRELQDQLAKFGVRPVAFGVTGISKDIAQARLLFQWAKGLNLVVINTESTDAMDTIEAMVKEFDIKVGFHNHPRRMDDPNYKVWDPKYILSIVKDRDKRIGACADTGHWVRSGIKPLEAIRLLKGRIVGSHMKDLHEFAASGHDVPYGLGVSDIRGILDEYKAQKFMGPASVEFEYSEDNNVVEVASCLGFVRGHMNSK